MAYHAGQTITTTITLLDEASDPIAGASFSIVSLSPDGPFVPTVTEVASGVYEITFLTTSAGYYYLQMRYLGPPVQTFTEDWNVVAAPYRDPTSASFGLITRRDLRRRILRQLGDLILARATANGSETTFIDQVNLIGESDAYRGRSAYFSGGTALNLDEERYVQGSSKTNRSLTFDYSLPAATAIGDEIEICNFRGMGYKFQDVHAAIDSAIENGADLALEPAYQLVTDYFTSEGGSVAIPEEWVGFGSLQWRNSDDEQWQALNMTSRAMGSGWSVDRVNRLVDIGGYAAWRLNDKQVRLYGFVRPGPLLGDDDTTAIDAEWLTKEAMSQLAFAKFLRTPTPELERVLAMNEQRAGIARSKATKRTGGMIRL